MLIVLLLFVTALSINAQKQIQYYYDRDNNLLQNSNDAFYKFVINQNINSKKGKIKIFAGEKLLYTGGFLQFNKDNPKSTINDGICNFYHQNGMKISECKYINGKKIGLETTYDEEGLITSTLPYINGVADEENQLQYAHYPEFYSTFKGEFLEDKNLNGEYTSYFKDGAIMTYFLKNSTLQMPVWQLHTPPFKNALKFATFEDDFLSSLKSNIWNYTSDNKATIEFVNDMLRISFTSFGFPRSLYLDDAPISLINNNFVIKVNISKESTAMGQGIEFGRTNYGNLHRIALIGIPGEERLLYENIVDGNFVNEATVNEIHYKRDSDNELMIRKKKNKIFISVNGYIVYEIDNPILIGNGISLFGVGRENYDQAYFKSFSAKIEEVKESPENIAVKELNGVYTVPVELNDVLKINFIFDSGASDVSITPDIALTLIKAGTIKETDWLNGSYYKFADGSVAKSRRFKLNSVKIGNKTIKNVTCSISNSIDAPILLGQSVLNKFGKYTFDYKKQILILE